jgi:predicted phage terminase large subunit-like protein
VTLSLDGLHPWELAALHAAADLLDPPPPRWATPGALAVDLEPATRQTPALELIDRALVDVYEGRDDRLAVSMAPQEGKSTKISRWFPLWWLARRPDTRIAIVSYELGVARRLSRQIRNDITAYGDELGLTVRSDTSAAHEWQLDGHRGGVYAVGVQGALTSRPVDLLIIDDPVKDWKTAQSASAREDAWLFWQSVAGPRLAPGAPAVTVATRWHHDDLIGRLTTDPETGAEWRVINIPAEADHDPAGGQADPLGREPGEFMISARAGREREWPRIKARSGSRIWHALYQGRPSPAEGDILKRDWWQYYETPLWIERPDGTRVVLGTDATVVQSWDLAFKDTAGSDFVVGQVWCQRGADVFLLDQVRERMSFTETVHAFLALTARWPQAALKLVEDKANGPAVISMLARKVPGIVPVEPDGSKLARASAVAPFVESGNVWLPDPDLAPWVMGFVEEAAGFPNGAHDDQVDTFSQAVNRLMLMPLLAGDDLVEDDELDEFRISAY